MRRKDKQIIDRAELEQIIDEAVVCRIAYVCDGVPYIVPVSFGYEANCLYFHSAVEGHKIAGLRRDNRVCFEMKTDVEVIDASVVCKCTVKYRSVVGHGRVSLIEETEAERNVLDIVTRHYHCGQDYSAAGSDKMVIGKITIATLTGKKSGCRGPPQAPTG